MESYPLFTTSKEIKINEKTFFPFSFDNYYRYLDVPYSVDSKLSILDLFSGEDKSYRKGCPFDDGDIIVEFSFLEENDGLEISHHPLSYRGPLFEESIQIHGIFINNRKDYFVNDTSYQTYRNKLRKLINNTSNKFYSVIKYYDELNETSVFKKPKNQHFASQIRNLVFNGLVKY